MVSKRAAKTDLELLFWFKGRVVTDGHAAVLHLQPGKQEKRANTHKPDEATERPGWTSLSRV